jgi:hypothetical protein
LLHVLEGIAQPSGAVGGAQGFTFDAANLFDIIEAGYLISRKPEPSCPVRALSARAKSPRQPFFDRR